MNLRIINRSCVIINKMEIQVTITSVLLVTSCKPINISALISRQLPKDSGPRPYACSGRGRRNYYNRVSKECELFLWGECGGNNNRFIFPHTCEEECTGN